MWFLWFYELTLALLYKKQGFPPSIMDAKPPMELCGKQALFCE